MGFPLGDWIDEHLDVPHSLGSSGMLGSLASTPRILAAPRRASGTLLELTHQLLARVAERLEVAPARVFLTHGATEANALVAFYLSNRIRVERGRAPRLLYQRPEYPPLAEITEAAGFRATALGAADLWIRSDPHNPTGHHLGPGGLETLAPGVPRALVDETFREFTDAPSWATEAAPGRWVTGTLTKIFGADAVRLGWVVAPPEESERFARFHPVAGDKIPNESLRMALDLLEAAPEVLAEARGRFDANRSRLDARLPGLGPLAGPVAFDRPGPADTRPFAEHCLSRGLLVCPGDFFGDPAGIRIGLTRRDFPESLDAYLRLRATVAEGPTRPADRATRARRRDGPTAAAPSARGARPRPVPRARGGTSGRSARRGPDRSR